MGIVSGGSDDGSERLKEGDMTKQRIQESFLEEHENFCVASMDYETAWRMHALTCKEAKLIIGTYEMLLLKDRSAMKDYNANVIFTNDRPALIVMDVSLEGDEYAFVGASFASTDLENEILAGNNLKRSRMAKLTNYIVDGWMTSKDPIVDLRTLRHEVLDAYSKKKYRKIKGDRDHTVLAEKKDKIDKRDVDVIADYVKDQRKDWKG